jgi:hypothetical protein
LSTDIASVFPIGNPEISKAFSTRLLSSLCDANNFIILLFFFYQKEKQDIENY